MRPRVGRIGMGAGAADAGLLEPPFYMDAFEEAFRFVIEDYPLPARPLAVFIPCAVRKPYSTSPSHRLFHAVLDRVLAPEEYQLLIFGTCGVVPAELERMYPFAHYRYMLGNVHDERVRRDFLEIETDRLAAFLEATRGLYERRAAYCIGLFREAMVRAVERSGVRLDLLLPTEPAIRRVYDPDSPFPEGSLSRAEYLAEFESGLAGLAR
jgi:archaeosine synthase alpha-subunit